MSNIWKKATSPTSVEDTARIILAKYQITTELRRAVRELQLNFIDKDLNKPICHGEEVESLCHSLEAIFIHGLKIGFARKIGSIFNANDSDKMPDPDFWPVVMVYSHKQVLSQISHLSNINADVGRCRSWIRMALNDGLLKSYLDSLIMDKSTLNSYYIQNAYLRDSEQPFIMRQFIEGLDVFKFQLTYNSIYLNSWSPEPLLLAGIWNPPESPEPVMLAEDVLESLTKSFKKATVKTKKSKKVPVAKSTSKSSRGDGAATTSSSLSETISISESSSLSSFPIEKSDSSENELKSTGASQNDIQDLCYGDSDNFNFGAQLGSSPQSVPGFEHMFVDVEINTRTFLEDKNVESASERNALDIKNSWSSCGDPRAEANSPDSETNFDSQSFDSIFQSYARDKPALHVLAATPELGCDYLKTKPICLDFKSEMDSVSTGTESPELSPDLSDFEVIPKALALGSSDLDESTRSFLSIFLKICPERGLDSQNYKCKECGCQIGMIYGNPLLCVYDGANYCKDCHVGDEYYIPSRILYNWDFRKHPVSKKAKSFLLAINEEPLIDVRKANPQLYTVVNELVEVQQLRSQLGFLRSYIFTCREDIADQFRKLLWPREYLFEHIHSYSVYDLLLIPNGTLSQSLRKAISFGKKHVLNCDLCTQKGFICEICNSEKIIYPFDTESTYHCEQCLAVYHSGCMDSAKPCPKCQRRKKRKESKDEFNLH